MRVVVYMLLVLFCGIGLVGIIMEG